MALAIVTVAAFLIVSATGAANAATILGGFIPARMTGLVLLPAAVPAWLTPLSATLIHAGALHLGFNLLMLVYCGREDEVAIGPWGIAILYGVGAYAAAAAQYAAEPASPVPMVGASGAISALVGAYALLYGRPRPSRFSLRVARMLHVAWLAAAWIVVQLLLGYASAIEGIGIAAMAHIGGFIAGLLLARPLLRWRYRKA